MPRFRPRRNNNNGFAVRQGHLSEFAMKIPKASAHVSSSALQKVGAMKAPIGMTEGWQKEAYGYFEIIGELAEVLNETSSSVARCDFRPIIVNDEGVPGGFSEIDDERIHRVWRAFEGPTGGKAALYTSAALNLQIAGEVFLVGQPIKSEFGADAGISWEFLSGDEIKVENNGNTIKRIFNHAGMPPEELDPRSYVARLWRKDPRFSEKADCAVKHVLPICSEVVLLTQVVDAIAKSRLSAGVLFVPDEMSFGPDDETEDDSDETDDIDPFTRELMEQLTAPVEDRTSAASLVPLIMRGPAEFADKVRLIEIARDLDHMYQEMRLEAIKRLATGLDIPVEIMFGKGGLNHWTGYNIDADFITKHIAPVGELIAEFLTSAYLRPMLVEFEEMTEEEAAGFRIFFDSSKITSRTDTGPNARAAYDRKVLSEIAYLRESGFDEADQPSEEERKERDLRALMEAEPVIFGPQIIGMLYPELAGVIVVPLAVPDQGQQDPTATPPSTENPQRKNPTGPDSNPVIDNETGQDEPHPRGQAGPRLEESLITRLVEASDEALEEALGRAGSKLRSRVTDKAQKASFATVDLNHWSASLSDAEFAKLGLTPVELLAGSWTTLAVNAKGMLSDYFIDMGVESFLADRKAAHATDVLIEILSVQAAFGLRNPLPPGPNGFRVPDEVVRTALTASETII